MIELLLVALLFASGALAITERRRRRAAPRSATEAHGFAFTGFSIPRVGPLAAGLPRPGAKDAEMPGAEPGAAGWAAAPVATPQTPQIALSMASRRTALVAIPLLALIAFLGFGGNSFRAHAVLSLLAAVILYVLVFRSESALPNPMRWIARIGEVTRASSLRIEIRWPLIALLAIILVAGFFRYYRLTETPSEMNSDHAEKYADIQTIQSGERPIFFPRNAGREGTQFYLASLLTGLTGYTYLTLKLVTVTASLIEVPFIFLLGRTLFGTAAGLFAALLLAFSKWDIGIGRFAVRASFAPMWSAVCLFLLYRALKVRSRNSFLLLGTAMGLGLYGYTSFRAVLVFVAGVVGAYLLLDRSLVGSRRAMLVNTTLAYGLTALLALPLLRYAVDFPQEFLFRSLTRTTGAEAPIAGAPPMVFLGNFWNMLQMFNVRGDSNWIQGVPGEPFLDTLTGILFLLGVGYALGRLLGRREVMPGTLLAGIAILTLPSTLALAFPNENPHPNRAGAVIPIVFLLAAIPLWQGWELLRAWLGRVTGWLVAFGLICALAGIGAQLNYQSYFVTYDRVYRQSASNHREVAAVISEFARTAGTNRSARIVGWPYWLDHRVVALELGDFSWKETALLNRAEDARQDSGKLGPKLYVIHRDDTGSPEVLREIFPQGVLRDHAAAVEGKSFRSFFVPG